MMNVIKIVFFLLLVFLIQSCNLSTTGTWKNNQIDRRKQEEIKALNDKLIKAMNSDDVAGVKELMSDSIRNNVDLAEFIREFTTSLQVENYKILDEYHVKNKGTGVINTLISENNNYEVNYLSLNKELYTSLLLTSDKSKEFLILAVYGKYGDDWKLNTLQYGQYRILGKTAADYFQLAKTSYDKSHLLNAINYISLSKQLLKPLTGFFKFKKEEEINAFYTRVMNEANTTYPLPLTLEKIGTKPQIYKITPQVTDEEFFPMIYYVSSININDEPALKNENEQIKKEVNRIFSGIDKDKKYIFYWASNELPDSGRVAEQYGFVDSLQVIPNL